MIARDVLMDYAHFDQVIANLSEALNRDESVWNQTLFSSRIVSAMYSAGYPIEDLRPVLKRWLVAATQERFPPPRDVVFPLCFAVMMGADDQDVAALEVVLSKEPECGVFAGFLADALGIPHPPVVNSDPLWLFFPEVRDLEDTMAKASFLAAYLEDRWYDANSEEDWWGLHERQGGLKYRGYWAWEIAATARVYGLDDTALCSCRYYPVDLAHYLDAKKGISEGGI